MNDPPTAGEQFMNLNTDEVVTFLYQESGEYCFSRPSAGPLSIPTELWYDDDVDWYESMGVRP